MQSAAREHARMAEIQCTLTFKSIGCKKRNCHQPPKLADINHDPSPLFTRHRTGDLKDRELTIHLFIVYQH